MFTDKATGEALDSISFMEMDIITKDYLLKIEIDKARQDYESKYSKYLEQKQKREEAARKKKAEEEKKAENEEEKKEEAA